jgi:ankyrin repeat protein
LKHGLLLLSLILFLTACSQERPATFNTQNEVIDEQESDTVATNGIEALMDAIINSELEKVKELVTEENVNQKDDLGNTPLMVAVQYMEVDIIQYLLDKGADPQIEDDLGISSLMMASESENQEIINLLNSHTSN